MAKTIQATTALKSWKGGLASKTCQPFLEFALAHPIASHIACLQEAITSDETKSKVLLMLV